VLAPVAVECAGPIETVEGVQLISGEIGTAGSQLARSMEYERPVRIILEPELGNIPAAIRGIPKRKKTAGPTDKT
jgi:hypothetical protein